MEANDWNAMREALEYVLQWSEDCISEEGADNVDDMIAVVKAALSAQPRVCDVNTLESLSDFVEKTILSSDLLKDTREMVRGIVAASVRTALAIAYEPAKIK